MTVPSQRKQKERTPIGYPAEIARRRRTGRLVQAGISHQTNNLSYPHIRFWLARIPDPHRMSCQEIETDTGRRSGVLNVPKDRKSVVWGKRGGRGGRRAVTETSRAWGEDEG